MKAKRNITVDIAKIIYSFVIVAFHAVHLLEERDAFTTSPIFGGGYVCVEFFFIVSGYLMCASTAKQPPYDSVAIGSEAVGYLKRKVLNILPYCIAAWILSVPAVCIAEKNTAYLTGNEFLFLFLNSAGFPSGNMNGQLWYLSAMFLATGIIYIPLRRSRNRFTHVTAPLLALFIYGYLSYTRGNISASMVYKDFFTVGMLRGLAGECLGCAACAAAEWLHGLKLTWVQALLLTVLELACYILSLYLMNTYTLSRVDFVLILIFFIAVTVSFSGQGLTSWVCVDSPAWIGRFSLNLYLIHTAASTLVKDFYTNGQSNFYGMFLAYVPIGCLLALINIVLGNFLKKLFARIGRALCLDEAEESCPSPGKS